jgi:hypothetical protein
MENTSVNTTPEVKPKRRFRKFLKISSIVIVVLMVAGFVSHWIWVASGTNEWKQTLEKDGVVVHTLKEPGKFVMQMKATKRIKSTLSAFVSVMQDVDAMCTHGCYEAKILKREDLYDSQILQTMTRFEMPFPFSDREWVLENHFSQDPQTRAIHYNVKAVPEIVPMNQGFVRITHFNNRWRFIPLKNGEVEVEWFIDMDHGGYVANLFHNLAVPDAMRNSFLEIEEMVQREKYQKAKHEFVKEADEVVIAER